jgi:hypothetical protein
MPRHAGGGRSFPGQNEQEQDRVADRIVAPA